LATIRDVAEEAQVSIATVSRVLNGNARVSEETRLRVESAAARLDYWPNLAARSLTRRASDVLGVLLPDLYGEFFSEVIRGIDSSVRERGQQVLLSSTRARTEEVLSAARSMRGRVDGLIIMAPEAAGEEAIGVIVRRYPTVLVGPRSPVKGCHTVTIANRKGAFRVVEHLIGSAGGPVAIVRGPARNVDAVARLRGYRDALRAAGITPDPEWELQGEFTERSGYRAGREILGRKARPRAVFCANDSMAVGLLRAFRRAGVRVPEEMAVAGFDDIALARHLDPPLTTARVDARRLGAEAVRLLVEKDRPPMNAHGSRSIMRTDLVVRDSSSPNGSTPELPEPAAPPAAEPSTSALRGRTEGAPPCEP
jgi:LacI family transcriptional regulator